MWPKAEIMVYSYISKCRAIYSQMNKILELPDVVLRKDVENSIDGICEQHGSLKESVNKMDAYM